MFNISYNFLIAICYFNFFLVSMKSFPLMWILIKDNYADLFLVLDVHFDVIDMESSPVICFLRFKGYFDGPRHVNKNRLNIINAFNRSSLMTVLSISYIKLVIAANVNYSKSVIENLILICIQYPSYRVVKVIRETAFLKKNHNALAHRTHEIYHVLFFYFF